MIRVVAAIATAICGAIIAFDSSSLSNRGWPTPPTGLVFWSIVVVALTVIWQFVDAGIERRRLRRRTELAHEISKLMFPVWYAVRTVAPDRATQERIGVHVWMVPTRHWNFMPEALRNLVPQRIRDRLPTPQMWRACHFRLKHGEHGSTDIKWRRDVGAIGISWRERTTKYFDLPAMWGRHPLAPADWGALTPELRLGLSQAQLTRLHAKYHSVLVVPILKHADQPGSSFIGCIVIDSLADHPAHIDVRKVSP